MICEVGPRDGLQNEKRILSISHKVELIDRLTEAGFKAIEVGSFMNPIAVPQMADTDEVFKRINQKPGVEYGAIIANLKGVERAFLCGCKKVKLNVSTSIQHNLANLNKTPEESIESFKICAETARNKGMDISGSISMAFGSPWEHRIPISIVRKLVDSYLDTGIIEISLSDTSGMAMPNQVYSLCTEMKIHYPEIKWILHFHNTRGMGIANIIAGMQTGITFFDSSIGGIGGCPFVPGAAGNVSSEDLIHMCDGMGIETGINLDMLIDIAKTVETLVGHELSNGGGMIKWTRS